MTDWKRYPGNRLSRQHDAGFYIIRPEGDPPSESVPVFCRICESIMSSRYDELAHEKFGCCDSCANDWAYPRKTEWISGWRPSAEEVQKCVSSRRRA